LGSREDAATHYAFPTVENLCSAPKRPGELDFSRQVDFCLRDQHTACPFYLHPDSPEAIAAPERLEHRLAGLPRGRLALAGIGVVVLALTILTIANSPISRSDPQPTVTTAPAATVRPVANATQVPVVPSATSTVSSPSPTRAASPTPTATLVTYVVVTGDTLARIASRYGVTVQAIVAANNLKDPNVLRVGTVLIIPTGQVTEIPSLQFTPSTPAASATP